MSKKVKSGGTYDQEQVEGAAAQVEETTILNLIDPPAVSPDGVVSETSRQKFRRLAGRRLDRALAAILAMEPLVRVGGYDRSDEQVAFILSSLRTAVDSLERAATVRTRGRVAVSIPE